jgi:mono/diheme cytochrome c family protein
MPTPRLAPLVSALLVLTFAPDVRAHDPATTVYDHACAWCHGKDGRGDGPAFFSIGKYRSPRPRDFTRGRFELRSTPSGELPTDGDLLRTVERGIPGYMPSFRGLTLHERHLAIAAVKGFYPGFEGASPSPVAIPEPPAADAAAIARGEDVYRAAGCVACHGDAGHGNGASAGDLRDETGLAIRPADLRYPTRFKNGSEPADVYRTLVTGLDGTPMPSYAGAFDDTGALWDLVAYVRSLRRR